MTSKERNKKYWAENKEKEYQRTRKWVSENRDKRRKIDRMSYSKNREIRRLKYKRTYQKNKEKYREYTLKKDFNMNLKEYQEILLNQNGVCAICGRPETSTYKGKVRQLAVDHNKKTGTVRGLLCSNCNIGLGHFFDDIDRLRNAILYLTRQQQQRAAGVTTGEV